MSLFRFINFFEIISYDSNLIHGPKSVFTCTFLKAVESKIWNPVVLLQQKKMMRFSQLTRESFALLGIDLDRAHQNCPFFNGRILPVYSFYWLTIISFCIFLRRETHDFREYIEVIFRTFLPIVIAICFTVIIFKMDELFEVFKSCGEIVDKSEYFFISLFLLVFL